MSDASRLPFSVQGNLRNGRRTFLCPTAEWALRKLTDFQRANYSDVRVIGPHGAELSESDLRAMLLPDATSSRPAADIDA